MKLVIFLLKRSPAGLPSAILLGLASGAASTGLLAVVHQAIHSLEATQRSFLLWTFIALCLAASLLRVLSQYLLVELSQRMVLELRLHLSRRILTTPLPQLESQGTPRLLAALIDDVNVVGQGLLQIPLLSLTIAIVLGAFGYMAWLSPVLFAVLMVVMLAGIVTYQLPFLWGDRYFRRAREEKDRLFQHLRSLTDGIRELKLHRRRGKAFVALLEGCGRTMHRFYIISHTIFAAAASWGHLLFFVVIGVLIFAVRSWYEVESSVLLGYALALLYLMNPLQSILDSLPQLSRAGVALDKVERLGLSLTPPAPVTQVAEWPARWQTLELRRARYTYRQPDDHYTFEFGPVDLTFEPGELVFIVGGNGSGKTTFMKLLTGLYPPDEGQILLGDEVIDDARREDYRQFFSLIFADPFIFQSLLGLDRTNLDEQARLYLHELGLHGKVDVQNGTLSTTSLSQGQRKRLALLTAYLEDRPTYVFDEWAADQDPAFREIFYREILPALKAKGKTVFVVSHDDRFYSLADRILKLESGKVIYDGPPESFPSTFSMPLTGDSAVPQASRDAPSPVATAAPAALVSHPPPQAPKNSPDRETQIPFLKRTAIGVTGLMVGLLLASVVGVLWFLGEVRESLPILEGERVLTGLHAPVQVERDALGIPTVTGQNRLDVARATGFLHAQDRFFQMDLLRRRSAGEIAELLGAAALGADRALRPHRFRARAEGFLTRLPTEQQALLEAYADGVNSGLASLESPPFEYLALRSEPREWQPIDSLLVLLTMFAQLQEPGALTERHWSLMADVLPHSLFDFLVPSGTTWDAAIDGSVLPLPPIPGPEVVDLRRSEKPPTGRLGDLPPGKTRQAVQGSNGWLLSGSRTGNHALLANDLHLDLAVPNLWYRMVLRWPQGETTHQVAGVTLPGLPAIVLGSNGRVSWGLTNSMVDTSDLILIELTDRDPSRYQTPEGQRSFQTHEERIRVRGGETQTLPVRETVWGPVIAEDHKGRPLAMRWTAHMEDSVNLEILDLETSHSVDDAVEIAHRSGIPVLNFLVADSEDRIAWTLAGRLPNRRGNSGRVAVSWADGEFGWDGLLDPREIPRVVDPEDGMLWNANSRILGGEELRLLGDNGYQLGVRASHIRDALHALETPDAEEMLALQLDDRALLLQRWRDLMVDSLDNEARVQDPRRAELHDLLVAWDGRASIDSAAYRFIRTFRILLGREIFSPILAACREADPDFDYADTFRQVEGPLWLLATQRPLHLLPPSFNTWDERLLTVIDETLRILGGENVPLASLTWGQRNTTAIQHPLSLAIPGLGRFLDMEPEPLPGGDNTPRVQDPSFGASLRMVVSPGHEDQGFFHMPGGQSGHPMSSHYRDGHEAWASGLPTPFLPGPTQHVLQLLP